MKYLLKYKIKRGEGQTGQLGHGDKRNRSKPTVVRDLVILKALQNASIEQIIAGREHSLVLTSKNKFYNHSFYVTAI